MDSKNNIPYYLFTIVLFLFLKWQFALSDNNSLIFLLKPTDRLLGIITGTVSQYSSTVGYYNKELQIVIEKSCSGFNFFLLCFSMLTFYGLNRYENTRIKILVFPVVFLISYTLTIIANTSRIILAITGQHAADNFLPHRPHGLIHEIIGAFVYLFFLILIYLSFKLLLPKQTPINAKLA